MSPSTLTRGAVLLIATLPCLAQTTVPFKNNRAMAYGDPNLNADWRWWEQLGRETVYFSPFGGLPQMAQVYLPWYTDGNILKSYEIDMNPQDGWVLAYKDFGTPNSAPKFPYFALYNQFRGKLRLMVFKPVEQNNTHYMAELKFMSDVAGNPMSTALLTFRAKEKPFLNDFNRSQVDSSIGEMEVYGSWGVFDFDLAGYDPKLNDPAVDPIVQIAITGVNVQNVHGGIGGVLNLNQVLNKSATLATTRSDFERVSDAVAQGSKYYKSVQGFQTDYDEWIKKQQALPSNERSSWLGTATSLAGLALSSYAPYASALVGFASSFFGGSNKSAPLEPMNFKGFLDLKVDATITDNQAILAPIDLYLKPGAPSPMAQRPVQSISWGVFNMTSKPALASENHYSVDYKRMFDTRTKQFIYIPSGNHYTYSRITGTLPEVIINPNLNMQLVSKKVKFIAGSRNQNWADFNFGTYYSMGMPSQVGLELTFRVNTPTLYSDQEIKVIKALPLGLTHTQVIDDNGPEPR